MHSDGNFDKSAYDKASPCQEHGIHMTTPPNNQEIELKLALELNQVDAFRRLMARRRSQPSRQELQTYYFDTPELALGDLGMALRLRRSGKRWIQTLKTEGNRTGGLSVRAEYETPVSGHALDLSRLPQQALEQIPQALREQLVPVFETRFVRTAWLLPGQRGARIEVALDVGEVCAGGRVLPVCEIELELKAGRSDALFDLALFLAERMPMLPLDASKAERGAMLARDMAHAPVKAGSLTLARDMIAEDGFAAICAACLAHFQANLPGLLLPLPNPPPQAGPRYPAGVEGVNARPEPIDGDPEYLHQARVALRRLRAGLRLYRNSCPLPAGESDGLQAGLRALAAALGPARDWDVLCLETLPAIQPHFADADEWGQFAAAAEAQRRAMRQDMLSAIRQANPGRWLLQFHRWLAEHGWRENPESRLAQLESLSRFAAQALHKGRRRIRRMGRNFSRLTPEQRHALRIAIKRQRYAAEFFRNLYPEQASARYVRALALAQDALGRANDARVAKDRLHDMRDSGCAFAVGFADGWLARQALETPPRKIARQVQAIMQWKCYW